MPLDVKFYNAKMHETDFLLDLAYIAPRPIAVFNGPTSKGREVKGKERNGERKGERREGRGCRGRKLEEEGRERSP